MADKGEYIDLTTASNRVGLNYVTKKIVPLTIDIGGVMAPKAHMAVFREKYIRREIYFSAIELLKEVNNPGRSAEELVAYGRVRMEEIIGGVESQNGMQTLSDAFNNLGEQIQEAQIAQVNGKTVRTTTGFPMVDFLTYGGFGPGNLVILAARPSVGKTATMLQMARAAAESGKVVNVFSLEMTNTELAQRLLLSTGRVQSLELARGQVEWSNFEAAVSCVEQMPMFLNDNAYSVDEIVSHIVINRQNGKCDIAFIDYLGLINTTGNKPQYQVLGEITHRLKSTAKKLGIPIVLLCQLNRAIESANRPPALHDLRDSGDIEQDADIVLMLERPTNFSDNRVNMYLRKNRQGPKDACIPLLPNDSYTNFIEIRQ
jgi:replicative DNA helicase